MIFGLKDDLSTLSAACGIACKKESDLQFSSDIPAYLLSICQILVTEGCNHLIDLPISALFSVHNEFAVS